MHAYTRDYCVMTDYDKCFAEKNCGQVPDQENGVSEQCTPPNKYLSTCNYHCDAGFQISDQVYTYKIECILDSADLKWDRQPPPCSGNHSTSRHRTKVITD